MFFQTHQHMISEPAYHPQVGMQDFPDAGSNAADTDKQRANVMAERYKTKMCRNCVSFGSCPYFEKCMFAHTPDELRTKEMNLRDGLTTEEAIRNYRRMLSLKRRFANGPTATVHQPPQQQRAPTNPAMVKPQQSPYPKSAFQSHQAHYRHPSTSPYQQAEACQCQDCINHQVQVVSNGWYHHNPYGWSPVPPQMLQDTCTCSQCAESRSDSPNTFSETCDCPECAKAQSVRCGLSQASSLDQCGEQCNCAACAAACTCHTTGTAVAQMP